MQEANPWEDFMFGCRFTEEKYALFSPEELAQMSVLSEEEAGALWDARCNNMVLERCTFDNRTVFIADCGWGDAKAEAETKRIYEEFLQDGSDVLVLYYYGIGLRSSKKVFCDRWSDFCYPSDVLLMICGDKNILYYEDEVFLI